MNQSPPDNPREQQSPPPGTIGTVPRWRLALAIIIIMAALIHLLLAPWTGWAIGTGIIAAIAAKALLTRHIHY